MVDDVGCLQHLRYRAEELDYDAKRSIYGSCGGRECCAVGCILDALGTVRRMAVLRDGASEEVRVDDLVAIDYVAVDE